MKDKIEKYFNAEFKLLSEYKDKFGYSSMYHMKRDKIIGAINLIQHINLISDEDIKALYHKLNSI